MTRATHIIDMDGPVHYVDHGGDGPTVVLLHGLGGFHLNWESVASLLTPHHRLLALDLVGFGLTPLAGRRATMSTQRELTARFIADVAGGSVTLVGNSMGGLVAMMAAADHPGLVRRLVLVNPALPVASTENVSRTTLQRLTLPLVPIIGPASVDRYYHTVEPLEQVEDTLNLLCYDPARVGPEARARAVEMVRLRREMDWANTAFTQCIRSIAALLVRRGRFARRVLHRVAAPTLLIHGNADAIVAPASARWAAGQRPDWTFQMLSGVGHIPMIEVPEAFVEIVITWLRAA